MLGTVVGPFARGSTVACVLMLSLAMKESWLSGVIFARRSCILRNRFSLLVLVMA